MTSQDVSVFVGRNTTPTQYTEPSHLLLFTREFLSFSTRASFLHLETTLHFTNLRAPYKKNPTHENKKKPNPTKPKKKKKKSYRGSDKHWGHWNASKY